MTARPLSVAIPKGRVLRALSPLLERAGIAAPELLSDDRRLVRESADGRARFLLLKPDDVPTYVEYGAADLGVSGRDVLLERAYDLYEPLDLGIGRCRMVVAAPRGVRVPDVPRVATKYPRVAARHFARRGVQAEIILVQGSVEIAPASGLADVVVDLVETGSTLAENDLVEHEVIARISSVLVVNRAQYKLRRAEIGPLVDALRRAADQPEEASSAATLAASAQHRNETK